MVEREGITSAISRLLAAAARGSGGALFVLGGPGMGKTAVLDHACRSAGGFGVRRSAAGVVEAPLAFGLAGSLGLGAGAGRPGAIEALTAAGPVLLAVDDLHWADPGSLAVLSSVCRRIGGLPVAVVAALRPWPPAAHAGAVALASAGLASVERLVPLSDAAAGELVGPAAAGDTLALAAGNPALLQWLAAGAGPFDTARFTGLAAAGLRCAQAAGVLGGRFAPEVALEVAGVGGDEEHEALASLAGGGLVRAAAGAGEVEVVPPLLARLLHDDLDPPVRALLHRRAFSALARRGFNRAAAEHAVHARLAGDPAAIAVVGNAGREALAIGSVADGVRLLRAAVDLAGAGVGDDLLLALGAALVEGGYHAEAIDVARRVRRRGTGGPAVQAGATRLLGHAHYASGQHEIAGAGFEEAVRLAEPDAPAVAVEALLLQSVLLALTAGPAQALPVAEEARRISTRVGGALARRADGTWGFVAVLAGDEAGAGAAAGAATALEAEARLGGPPHQAWREVTLYGAAAKYVERLADSERIYRDLGGAARHGQAPAAVAALCTGYADTLLRAGRLDEALELAGQACDVAGEATHVTATLAMATMAHALLLAGRLEESDEWCDRAEAAAGRREWLGLLRIWDLRGMRRLRQGRVAEAADLYARCRDLTTTAGLREPCVVPWAGHAVGAFVASRRLADAATLVEWLRETAAGLPCRWPAATAAGGQAALDERAGRHDAAGAGLEEALALLGQVDLPLERAEALIAYGAFLRRRGRPGAARPPLAEALHLAEAAGAGWVAAEAGDELALAGGRRRRPGDDPGALTPSEARVARLAAAGAGNRDIAEQLLLSVNTVESHLRRVYAKLGIRSRRDLIVKFATWDGDAGVISSS